MPSQPDLPNTGTEPASYTLKINKIKGFPDELVIKGRFKPWVRRYPGEGTGNPLQYSSLVNIIDRVVGLESMGSQESDTT